MNDDKELREIKMKEIVAKLKSLKPYDFSYLIKYQWRGAVMLGWMVAFAKCSKYDKLIEFREDVELLAIELGWMGSWLTSAQRDVAVDILNWQANFG